MSDDDGGWFDFGGEGGEGGSGDGAEGGGNDWGPLGDFVGNIVGIVVLFTFAGAVLSTCVRGGGTYRIPDPPDLPDAPGFTSPSQPAAPTAPAVEPLPPIYRPPQRTGRNYGNAYCYRIIQEAKRNDQRDWERWLPEDVKLGCRPQIERERNRPLPDPSRPPQDVQRPHPASPQYERGEDRIEIGVPYDDLDLSTEEGARLFLSRLRQAATRACGGRPDAREIKEMQRFRRCVADEMDRVVALLNKPMVTAVHRREG